MSNIPTIRAKVLRDFTDAGSERRFTKDQVETITTGEFENYRAAGLVEVAAEEPVDTTDGGETTTRSGRSRS